ncbi:MAG TPA: hypothetical protein VKR53_04350 [Puia sp.]|nr:hypothetical protein [Puia sp.]
MNKLILTAVIPLLFSACAHAQDSSFFSLPVEVQDTVPVDKLAVGIGGGYEYGGIGANVIYFLTKGLGVFAGAGYPLTGFGYNAGFKLRIVVDQSSATFMPYIVAMYGYNGTIVIPEFQQKNKTFYGATVGAGIDYRPGNSRFGYLSASVYIPFRDITMKEYAEYLNYTYGITYSTGRIFPLSASIGYKFILQRHKISPPAPIQLP